MALTPEDRLDILDVIARYNLAADEKDVEGTVALYTEDGRIEGDFEAGPGREAFRSGLQRIFDGEGSLKRHVSTNHILEGDGEHATVRSLLIVFEGETSPAVGATVRIHDELRKQDGRWLVERHLVIIDPSLANAMAAQGSEGRGGPG